MRNIYLLTDYKGRFGSRYDDSPYRNGMDLELLRKFFLVKGFETVLLPLHKVNFLEKNHEKKIILYTSSEDYGYHYKDYIEDIVLGLEIAGSLVIPSYKLLRANNNKIFMEIIRDQLGAEEISSIKSTYYGTLEDLKKDANEGIFDYPVVLKPAAGAMSEGVSRARNREELIRQAAKISATKDILNDLKDIGRQYKHKGYIRESRHRMKFTVQNFIPGLENDYKVLIFGNKYYALKRLNRVNDFRASGGGRLSYIREIPPVLLDFAKKTYELLDVPQLSLDLAYDGKKCHLFEFQAVYFGSYTLTYSEFYFTQKNKKWEVVEGKSCLEEEYAESTVQFIEKRKY